MEKDILTRPIGWCSLQECKRLYDGGLNPNTADMCWGIDGESQGEKGSEPERVDFAGKVRDVRAGRGGRLSEGHYR